MRTVHTLLCFVGVLPIFLGVVLQVPEQLYDCPHASETTKKIES